MTRLGFSTGALALADFRRALEILAVTETNAIELSALRFPELLPLITSLPNLNLQKYKYIAIHAPSSFTGEEEKIIVGVLSKLKGKSMHVIVHPDSIHDFGLWAELEELICIENMDSRKKTGRTVKELQSIFEYLPKAKFCLDVAHARQLDSSMVESYLMLSHFRKKLVQIHISEVNTASHHMPLSEGAISAYKLISSLIPPTAALIFESRIDDMPTPNRVEAEIMKASEAFSWISKQ